MLIHSLQACDSHQHHDGTACPVHLCKLTMQTDSSSKIHFIHARGDLSALEMIAWYMIMKFWAEALFLTAMLYCKPLCVCSDGNTSELDDIAIATIVAISAPFWRPKVEKWRVMTNESNRVRSLHLFQSRPETDWDNCNGKYILLQSKWFIQVNQIGEYTPIRRVL